MRVGKTSHNSRRNVASLGYPKTCRRGTAMFRGPARCAWLFVVLGACGGLPFPWPGDRAALRNSCTAALSTCEKRCDSGEFTGTLVERCRQACAYGYDACVANVEHELPRDWQPADAFYDGCNIECGRPCSVACAAGRKVAAIKSADRLRKYGTIRQSFDPADASSAFELSWYASPSRPGSCGPVARQDRRHVVSPHGDRRARRVGALRPLPALVPIYGARESSHARRGLRARKAVGGDGVQISEGPERTTERRIRARAGGQRRQYSGLSASSRPRR
jgi:hypothetical protein